jgi:hypothetical protein
MNGEGTSKSGQTNLRKNDNMATSKYKRLHLPPLHDDVETTSRTTFFEAGGDDAGWLSDSTTSCASTIKSNIIEAWKRRKKKNDRNEASKRHKKRHSAEAGLAKAGPHRLKLDHRLKLAQDRLKLAYPSQLCLGLEATYVIFPTSDPTTPSSWLPIYMGHFPLP